MRAFICISCLLVYGCQQSLKDQKVVKLNHLKPIIQNLDFFLDSLQKNQDFNGALLVAQEDKIIYNKTIGYANIETKDTLQSYSAFRVAAISKQFTAMTTMILKEEGKLDYEDDIKKYLPELPYKGISIRHLLTHTSGLPKYKTIFEEKWDVGKDAAEKDTAYNEDVLNLLMKYRPGMRFKPGEKWEYSNTGYVLLALITERVSKLPYRDFLRRYIFRPLRMQSTLAFYPAGDFKSPKRVYGFVRKDSSIVPNDWHYSNGVLGDGGNYSNTLDLFKWNQALYREKLVSQETLAEAFAPTMLNDGTIHPYGFGWSLDKNDKGEKTVEHYGSRLGFKTYVSRETVNRSMIILLTNYTCENIDEILEEVYAILGEEWF